jgi:hypothetical protein
MTNAEATNETANATEQGAAVAPEKASSKKGTSQKKDAPKGKKAKAEPTTPFDEPEAKAAKAPKAKATKKATKKAPKSDPKTKGASERSNKKAAVIAMMKRAKGVTLPEIMAATGWQAHTVRGFVSLLGSKQGEKIESSKNAAGERTYRIAK